MDTQIEQRFHSLFYLIGNTPLLEIHFKFRGEPRRIFAKAEFLNMTGSIKDRMALHILRRAAKEGRLQPGDNIIEATSGNTGISFAATGRALGHPVVIFMPDWMSRERVDVIRSLGADIRSVSKEQGGFTGSIAMAEDLARDLEHSFLPRQFANEDNVEAHRTFTGPEIWQQLFFLGIRPDAFVAGVGTGGTVMGVGRYFKSQDSACQIHPLEPASSPTLRTGCKMGSHRIQGVSDEFIPPVVDLNELDDVVDVHDGDAILMAQMLARDLGLAVGISSGANFLGALQIQNGLSPLSIVTTVLPDDNKKYLSTDLLKDEPVKPEYLSPDIQLTHFAAHNRVCEMCFDYEMHKGAESVATEMR
jgi:cysteine synthase A